MSDPTDPDDATTEADEADAQASHGADRPPTAEEEAAAPESVDPKVAEAHKEANERGAAVKGEGEIS